LTKFLKHKKHRELPEMSKNKKTVVCLCGGGSGTHILAGTLGSKKKENRVRFRLEISQTTIKGCSEKYPPGYLGRYLVATLNDSMQNSFPIRPSPLLVSLITKTAPLPTI